LASSACTRPLSEVAKYSLPSRTAGELITHDPLLENDQRCAPLAASSAYRFESRQPKYTIPSATTAEDWMPSWLWIAGSSPVLNRQRCLPVAASRA
jgi:hypothetical protein